MALRSPGPGSGFAAARPHDPQFHAHGHAAQSRESASSSLSPLRSPALGHTRQRLLPVHQAASYSASLYSTSARGTMDDEDEPGVPALVPSQAPAPAPALPTVAAVAAHDDANEDDSQLSWMHAAARHLLRRLVKAARAANWPVVIAFCSCVVILARALTGAGYDPSLASAPALPPFDPSQPSPNPYPNPYANANLPSNHYPAHPAVSSPASPGGWAHWGSDAWEVWRKVREDLRLELEENREKWVGSVRPERQRGKGKKKGKGKGAVAESTDADSTFVVDPASADETAGDVYLDESLDVDVDVDVESGAEETGSASSSSLDTEWEEFLTEDDYREAAPEQAEIGEETGGEEDDDGRGAEPAQPELELDHSNPNPNPNPNANSNSNPDAAGAPVASMNVLDPDSVDYEALELAHERDDSKPSFSDSDPGSDSFADLD